MITTDSALDPWIVRPAPRPAASGWLLCFGIAGSNASSFHQWPLGLPATIEVGAVQLPGRQRRFREPPATRLLPLADAIAEFLSPRLSKPFAFFGACTGALLAFEVARRIRERTGREPARFIAACCRAPHLPDRDPPIHQLPDSELIVQLRRLGGTSFDVLNHPELMKMILGTIRADFEAAETYPGAAVSPFRCPVTAILGKEDTIIDPWEISAWRDHTLGPFRQMTLPGGHYLVETHTPALLQALGEELQPTDGLCASTSKERAGPVSFQRKANAALGRRTQDSEGYVEVPGGRVWYRVMGDGDGIPLLALHGGPGSPHDYLESLATLGNERPIVFYDQLGCGRSDHPDDPGLWNMDRFLAELDRVRARLSLDQLHLYGHSWGAMLAVDYALLKPAGLRGLVLASPCVDMAKVRADLARLKGQMPPSVLKLLQDHESAGTTASAQYQVAALAFYRRHVCRLTPWPKVLEQWLATWGHQVYNSMWGPAEFTVTGSLRDYDRSGRLGELAPPVLFLCGRHDEITPETTESCHRLCPGSEFVVFENSAHLPQLEEPEGHSLVVREFLRRAERAPSRRMA